MRRELGLAVLAVGFIIGPLLVSQLRSQQPTQAPVNGAMASSGSGGSSSASSGNLIMSSQTTRPGRTQLVILDTATRSLASYFVDSETGAIELKSVRNIDADLRLKEFNGTKPSPDEVRAVLQP